MGDGRWVMGDGRWVMGDGRWIMGDGAPRCEDSRTSGSVDFDDLGRPEAALNRESAWRRLEVVAGGCTVVEEEHRDSVARAEQACGDPRVDAGLLGVRPERPAFKSGIDGAGDRAFDQSAATGSGITWSTAMWCPPQSTASSPVNVRT